MCNMYVTYVLHVSLTVNTVYGAKQFSTDLCQFWCLHVDVMPSQRHCVLASEYSGFSQDVKPQTKQLYFLGLLLFRT